MKFDMLNFWIRKMRTRWTKDIMVFRSPCCIQASWVSTVVSVCQSDHLFKYKNPLNYKVSRIYFHIASMSNNSSTQRSTMSRPQALVLRDKNHCWTALSNFLSSLQNVGNSLFISFQGLSIGRLAVTGHEDSGENLVSKVPLWHQWVCRAD